MLRYPAMLTTVLTVDASTQRIIDLTPRVRQFCAGQGDGLLNVFAPHATAGLAIIEVGDGSDRDLERELERLLPRDDRYVHHHDYGSPGHGADHVLPGLVAPTLVVPVIAGQPALGIWQSIVLVDLNRDNPIRQIRLSLLPG
jgi:secondary thiamine-phosphate synthase enzyme